MKFFVRLKAPFAAFRTFSAGSSRPTLNVIPPTAALGLIYNFASIDSRGEDLGRSINTVVDTPPVKLAIGMINEPTENVSLQQGHSYLVGSSGKARRHFAAGGQKTHIAPIRVGTLSQFDCVLGVEADDELGRRVERGLNGELERYGVPTLGDGGLLFDSIMLSPDVPVPARWCVPPGRVQKATGAARLPLWIDRANSAGTIVRLFQLTEHLKAAPDCAWMELPPREVR